MKEQHLLLPISILFLSCTTALGEVPYKQHPFLAEYKVTAPILLASSRLRVAYDGHGHARLEECDIHIPFHRSKNVQHISFLDFNTNTSRRLIQDEQRIALEILGDAGCEYVFPRTIYTQYTKENLGPRTIRSHRCHGWRYQIDHGSFELWIDDELGIPVWMKDSPDKSEWASGSSITRLVNYSSSPNPEDFTIPPEYSEKAK